MNNFYLGIKFALSYFTVLPIRFREGDDLSHPHVLSSMLYALPFVGILLAGVSIGIFEALAPLGWLAAILASVLYMALYGFIHTEAIIDVADALYAAHSGKDPYAVIKEPTVGAMGVLYGVSFLLLKIAALSTLLMHHLFLPFIAIAAISRLALIVVIRVVEFRSSFVSQLKASLSPIPLIVMVSLYGALGLFTLSWPFAGLLLLGVVIAVTTATLTRKSLGFLNGDGLGMALELVELILILVVVRLWV
ncbi:MAG: adenosylcobinamide-GDP ribazoletransferase [Sulfuricurvum sp.]|uniref:adenosylcobinamide-GDP ribazoletransferase n=1 Tax=Sulfuricurvum sp. TaxID=2025608 RepID=UPI0025DD7987|nr:adenosylcobinamide-GDP ribazoletransferase [Sulfuricurvum sp.]MCK9371911.1 adenosylcobinamide-GDP ribazoletransferase [Sulfuricurvum sp.]